MRADGANKLQASSNLHSGMPGYIHGISLSTKLDDALDYFMSSGRGAKPTALGADEISSTEMATV